MKTKKEPKMTTKETAMARTVANTIEALRAMGTLRPLREEAEIPPAIAVDAGGEEQTDFEIKYEKEIHALQSAVMNSPTVRRFAERHRGRNLQIQLNAEVGLRSESDWAIGFPLHCCTLDNGE